MIPAVCAHCGIDFLHDGEHDRAFCDSCWADLDAFMQRVAPTYHELKAQGVPEAMAQRIVLERVSRGEFNEPTEEP